MKHESGKKSSVLLVAMVIALCQCAHAQVVWNFSGQYWLHPHNPPQSFAIGDAPTAGYALDVHGELMTPQLGNVFKTDAPGHMNTYWRMFHGQDEFGQLFHLVDEKQFNINAPLGHLL